MAVSKAETMLSWEERERLQDCMLLISSVQQALNGVNPGVIPNFEEIEECIASADKALKKALRQ